MNHFPSADQRGDRCWELASCAAGLGAWTTRPDSGSTVATSSVVSGRPPIVVSDGSGAFSVDVPILCNVVEDIEVASRDRAGNERRLSVPALCDDQPPQIQLASSTFLQEGAFEYALDATGMVDYSAGSAAALTIDDQTVWPIRIEKHFNRLDEGSPNLATIRFFAHSISPEISRRG